MQLAVTGARGTTPEQNETIRNAIKAHTGANWHIGDATGADECATHQAKAQGDTVTTYCVTPHMGKAGYAMRSMKMIDGAIAMGAKKLLAFPNKSCPKDCTPSNPFCGHGSGTWGTIAYAKKKGLEVEMHPLSADVKTPDWMRQLTLF